MQILPFIKKRCFCGEWDPPKASVLLWWCCWSTRGRGATLQLSTEGVPGTERDTGLLVFPPLWYDFSRCHCLGKWISNLSACQTWDTCWNTGGGAPPAEVLIQGVWVGPKNLHVQPASARSCWSSNHCPRALRPTFNLWLYYRKLKLTFSTHVHNFPHWGAHEWARVQASGLVLIFDISSWRGSVLKRSNCQASPAQYLDAGTMLEFFAPLWCLASTRQNSLVGETCIMHGFPLPEPWLHSTTLWNLKTPVSTPTHVN